VQQASCYIDGVLEYTKAFDVSAAAGSCHPFAEGVGGVVNNGAWNQHAHGDHVDADNQELASGGVDGRVPRFVKFMTAVKTQLDLYLADDDHSDDATPPSCTGNTAVDFILNAANLESVTEINAAASVYKWDGLCTALKEFTS